MNPLQNAALLLIWIVFAAMSLLGVIAVFIWAVRTRQFSRQDRARYLALRQGPPGEEGPGLDGEPQPPAKNDVEDEGKSTCST